jgi:hypothetical protein
VHPKKAVLMASAKRTWRIMRGIVRITAKYAKSAPESYF